MYNLSVSISYNIILVILIYTILYIITFGNNEYYIYDIYYT